MSRQGPKESEALRRGAGAAAGRLFRRSARLGTLSGPVAIVPAGGIARGPGAACGSAAKGARDVILKEMGHVSLEEMRYVRLEGSAGIVEKIRSRRAYREKQRGDGDKESTTEAACQAGVPARAPTPFCLGSSSCWIFHRYLLLPRIGVRGEQIWSSVTALSTNSGLPTILAFPKANRYDIINIKSNGGRRLEWQTIDATS